MKKLISICVLLLSSALWAHVPPGQYQGKDNNGKACSFWVGNQWFVDNKPHPLNERIPVGKIQIEDLSQPAVVWNLFHPPVVDAAQSKVRFNHDLFHEVAPTNTGAALLILVKGQAEDSAPQALIYVEDNYKDSKKSVRFECRL